MRIKHLFINLAVALAFSATAMGQTANDIGLISLNPYIPESEGLGQKATAMLQSKLLQIATVNGMSGAGFDNRFIITAHIQKLRSSQTQTFPQKNAVEVSIGIYVGDGLDGTLYSSYTCEAKGIGDSEDQAIASAIRKVVPTQEALQSAIIKGKEQIQNYYDKMSGSILQTAKATAAAGRYDDAVNMLFAIPMNNKDFQTAQALIAQYGSTSLDNKNLEIVRQARSAWSANPTEEGASEASTILQKLDAPSAKVQAEAKSLQTEMASRLKAVSDREYQQELKQEQNEKEERLAAIKAAASVAKAYIASQPRVVYHYHWW